jgi:D-3-phosphoglycerate dehydrogenase
LLKLENCITVPHIGASTKEAQINVGIETAREVVDYLSGKPVRNAVNIHQVDPDILEEIGPYLSLAEKIGSLHAQLTEGRMEQIEMCISGDIANYEIKPFTIAVLKGMLSVILREPIVNYVNAPFIAQERGIKILERKIPKDENFVNLISVNATIGGVSRRIDGSIFQKNDPRIVSIDGFRIDAIPEGNMLIVSNIDRPGIVGMIGTILGRNNINIAGLQMGREVIGGQQRIVLNLDQAVSNEILEEIRSQKDILDIKLAKL